jgi:transposase
MGRLGRRSAHEFGVEEMARPCELETFRRTLLRWRREIVAYFGTGLTNARTECFNNKAKLVKKRAYGYGSFRNYRLRLLNAWA